MPRPIKVRLSELEIIHGSNFEGRGKSGESFLTDIWVVRSPEGKVATIYDWGLMRFFKELIDASKSSSHKGSDSGDSVPGLEPELRPVQRRSRPARR